VQAYPQLDAGLDADQIGEARLHGIRRLDCLPRRGEHRHHLVADGLDYAPAVSRGGVLQAVDAFDHGRHGDGVAAGFV
jgi:hypothetical protein